MNAGNSAGAKGHRFERVNRGNMPRHRAENMPDHTADVFMAFAVISRLVKLNLGAATQKLLDLAIEESRVSFMLIFVFAMIYSLPQFDPRFFASCSYYIGKGYDLS